MAMFNSNVSLPEGNPSEISGLTPLISFITGVLTYNPFTIRGMSHQVYYGKWMNNAHL